MGLGHERVPKPPSMEKEGIRRKSSPWHDVTDAKTAIGNQYQVIDEIELVKVNVVLIKKCKKSNESNPCENHDRTSKLIQRVIL